MPYEPITRCYFDPSVSTEEEMRSRNTNLDKPLELIKDFLKETKLNSIHPPLKN